MSTSAPGGGGGGGPPRDVRRTSRSARVAATPPATHAAGGRRTSRLPSRDVAAGDLPVGEAAESGVVSDAAAASDAPAREPTSSSSAPSKAHAAPRFGIRPPRAAFLVALDDFLGGTSGALEQADTALAPSSSSKSDGGAARRVAGAPRRRPDDSRPPSSMPSPCARPASEPSKSSQDSIVSAGVCEAWRAT